jgi:hypothetical protein
MASLAQKSLPTKTLFDRLAFKVQNNQSEKVLKNKLYLCSDKGLAGTI